MLSIRKVIAGFFLLALVVATTACHRRAHQEMTNEELAERVEKGVERAVDDLDGTDAQADEIKVQVRTLLPDVFALRAKKDPTKAALQKQLMSPNPDLAAVDGIIDDVSSDLTAFALKAAPVAVNVHGILDGEQRLEIAERWEGSAAKWSKRRRSSWMADAVFDRGLDEIEATDAQGQYALEKKAELTEKGEKLRAQKNRTRTFFLAQLKSDRPDADAINAEIQKTSKNMTGFAHEVSAAVIGFAKTLTPEQRARIAEMIAEHHR